MENNLVKLFNDWEIQLLVLLSFAIQIFLFFTGGLRRYGTNVLISLSIWIAYLGADTVAVYALGYLSRQEEDAHSLAFFWAPFLLIHLGNCRPKLGELAQPGAHPEEVLLHPKS